METISFNEAVEQILTGDSRYPAEAYYFVRDGLDYTVNKIRGGKEGAERHISGAELSDGLVSFAVEQFGPMAAFTLKSWHLRETGDFGEVVFNLIEAGRFSKRAEERKEDFWDLFNLEVRLRLPYEVEGFESRRLGSRYKGR